MNAIMTMKSTGVKDILGTRLLTGYNLEILQHIAINLFENGYSVF